MQQLFPPTAEKWMDGIVKEWQPCISAITEIELLCWKSPTEKDVAVLNNFMNDLRIIELESPIKFKTAEIRKLHKIKLPDAIIAATAIIYNYILLTRNINDFNDINGLKIENPWDK